MIGYLVTCDGKPQKRIRKRVYDGARCRARIALTTAWPATIFESHAKAQRAVENSKLAMSIEVIAELQDELNTNAWRIWEVETGES